MMTQSALISLRESVAAMVRRRVPEGEVDDIAQTILCDALAAPRVPDDAEELRRFVAGIARHKVADFHRRARRRPEGAESAELPVEAADFESRALLGRVAASVDSARERQTFEWLVREHHGEQLADIATSAGIPATAVRQRVSRLRRALRARWAHALLLCLVAGSCGALARGAASRGEAIVADPIGDDATRAIGLAQGRWRVDRVLDGSPIAATLAMRVDGARVTIDAPSGTVERAIVRVAPRADGGFDLDLRDDGGRVDHATARLDDTGIVVILPQRGAAHLVRR
jgi:DNA-directed RNA polymerase specialized sigma24 family protein